MVDPERTTTGTESNGRDRLARRRLLRVTGAGLVATGLAGCSSTEQREYEADPAALAPEAGALGFTRDQFDWVEVSRTETVGGTSLEVTLVNYGATYDGDPVGIGVGATPKAEEAGQSLNPVVGASFTDLLTGSVGAEMRSQIDLGIDEDAEWVRGPDEIDATEGELLDSTVEARTFLGTTDEPEAVVVHLARTTDRGDAVLVGSGRSRSIDPEADRPLIDEAEGVFEPGEIDEGLGVFLEALPLVIRQEAPRLSGGEARTVPEYEVVQRGIGPEEGSALIEALTGEFALDNDLFGVSEVGELQYIDPEGYRAVPTRGMEPMTVSDEDEPERTIEETIDVERLADLPEPPDPGQVTDALQSALDEAGIGPEALGFSGAGEYASRHPEVGAVDAEGEVLARSQFDTVVEVYPRLDDTPVVGPGAKIRATVGYPPGADGPTLTDLRHAFYGVEEGDSVEILEPQRVQDAYRERIGFGEESEVSLETTLVYYAPALDRTEEFGDRLRPYYEVRGEVETGDGSYRPFPLYLPAWSGADQSAAPVHRGGGPGGSSDSLPGLAGGDAMAMGASTGQGSDQVYRGEFAVESNIFRRMGQNLSSALKSIGVRQDAYEERFDVDESDFEAPGDNGQIDKGDLTFEVVHGSSDALWFEKPNQDWKSKFGDDRADGDWGDNDLEWLLMFNCDTLYPGEWWGCPEQAGWNGPDPLWERWGDNMDGAHLLLGFRTYGFPGPWNSKRLVFYLYRDAIESKFSLLSLPQSLTVAQAWHLMLDNFQQNIKQSTRDLMNDRCLPIGRSTVLAPMTRRGNGWYCNIDDRVWGEGTVGRDIPRSDHDGFYIQLG